MSDFQKVVTNALSVLVICVGCLFMMAPERAIADGPKTSIVPTTISTQASCSCADGSSCSGDNCECGASGGCEAWDDRDEDDGWFDFISLN